MRRRVAPLFPGVLNKCTFLFKCWRIQENEGTGFLRNFGEQNVAETVLSENLGVCQLEVKLN